MVTNPKGAVKNLADMCVKEILEMSDEEILREYEEEDLDIEQEVRKIEDVVNKAIDQAALLRLEETND